MKLNSLKIATKLWVFIILVLALLVLIAGVGLARSSAILSEGRERLDIADKLVQVTTRWNGLTETNAARNHAIIVSSDPAILAAFKDLVAATTTEISVLQKELEALPLTDADKVQLAKIADLRKAMIGARDKTRAAKAEGRVDEALQVFNAQYVPAMAAYIGGQKELI